MPFAKAIAYVAAALAMGGLCSGCETLKPYEKEYLLSPVMEDSGVASLGAPLMTAAASGFEKLGGGSGASGGTSCPTCGG